MWEQMISQKDVAKKVGISISTVSRALNDSPLVNDETKARVMEAIKELGYQPNLVASSLRRSETKLIICMQISLSNFFMTEFSDCFLGMQKTASKYGYKVILCPVDLSREVELEYLNLLKSKLVDGVIFVNSMLRDDELKEIGQNYPAVQCSEYKESIGIPFVSIDNVQASMDATNHLIGLGHRNIGMISSVYKIPGIIRREEGFKKALEKAGIQFNPDMIKHGINDFSSGIEMTKQFLSMSKPPTAIFCISDAIARGCVQEIIMEGKKIPEDVAVVGFNNSIMSSLYWPKITTVSQPIYEIGSKSAEMLIKILKNEKDVDKGITLKHEIIVRESTVKEK